MDNYFKEFLKFEKYSYSQISKPNQSFKEKFNNFKFIFLNSYNRSAYFKDCKDAISNNNISVQDRQKIKRNNIMYNIGEAGILIYVLSSFRWHYKQGYF